MKQAMIAMGARARRGGDDGLALEVRGPSGDARVLWPLRVMLALRRGCGGCSIFLQASVGKRAFRSGFEGGLEWLAGFWVG